MRRPYKLGLVLGRFQGLHIGHEAVINKALSVCERVIVMIGSADKSGTLHDPFTTGLRVQMLQALYPRLSRNGRVILVPLKDLGVGNVPAWGDYVIENAKKAAGMPDCIVYGDEDKCRTWFPNYPEIRYISLDRGDIDINGTRMRKILLDGDEEAFRKHTRRSLYRFYPRLRKILLEIVEKEGGAAKDTVAAYACEEKK